MQIRLVKIQRAQVVSFKRAPTGWPITLVLMGVAFLAVGTIALRVKRRI